MLKAPVPKSLLGRHRLLAPSAGIRVSPLCLGGMNIGSNWNKTMGENTKENAFELLDTFYDLGGNFIDTANAYQGGQSEEWIGEWMKKTGRRDDMIIATKYAHVMMHGQTDQLGNYGGTSTKAMHVSVEASLKRLQTDYIDIYFVHHWDYVTGIPELMQSLNTLVQSRKVLYLGISDVPAWVVVKANCYAREHGLRQFSIYQGLYSAQDRSLERDVIPMCLDEGMAIHVFGALGRGHFKAPGTEKEEGGRNTPFMKSEKEEQVSGALDIVAKRLNVSIHAVALAYVMHKAPYVFPVLGGRKVEQLKANVDALSLSLSPEDIADIEKGYEFDSGFPHSFVGMGHKVPKGPGDVLLQSMMGYYDYVQGPQPIKPHQGDLGSPQVF